MPYAFIQDVPADENIYGQIKELLPDDAQPVWSRTSQSSATAACATSTCGRPRPRGTRFARSTSSPRSRRCWPASAFPTPTTQ